MKITKSKLKQIIKEELANLREARSKPGIDHGPELPGQDTGYEEPPEDDEEVEEIESINSSEDAAKVFLSTLGHFLETNAPGLANDEAEVKEEIAIALHKDNKIL